MQHLKTALLLSVLLSLSACAAIDTAFDRVGGAFNNALNTEGEPSPERLRGDPATVFSEQCPKFKIVKELETLSEFTNPNKPKDSELISRVKVVQSDSSCTVNDNNAIINIKLAFESELGPKAKIHKNDKPYFSYPFFVAIADFRGKVLAKEVFAASMTYDRDEDNHTYYENIRQIVPLEARRNSVTHTVYIGFQLSDEQLSYNRKTMAPPPTIVPLQKDAEHSNAPEILHPSLAE